MISSTKTDYHNPGTKTFVYEMYETWP